MGKKIVPYNGPLSKGMRVVLRRVPGAPHKAEIITDPEDYNCWMGSLWERVIARSIDGREYSLKRNKEGDNYWECKHLWYASKQEAVEIERIDDWASIINRGV